MRIKAVILEMATSEIMSIIDPGMYRVVKASDPNPHFKAFVVGHEGESSGKVAVDGENFVTVIKRWYRSAIEMLHDKIQLGISLFKGHGLTNRERGRISIGEVVGKSLQDIDGVLSEVVIGYLYPEFIDEPLDVASIEANIMLSDEDGVYRADVESVSGIALGNSKTETPGFAGATLLGVCQEFVDKNKSVSGRSEEMAIETIDEAKALIKSKRWHPSELFSMDELTGDPMVEDEIGKMKDGSKNEYYARKREREQFDTDREKWKTDKEEMEKKITSLTVDVSKSKITDLFKAEKESRKFDEKESEFIEKKLGGFNPQDPEKVKEDFSKFLDTQIDDYNDFMKIHGLKSEEKEEKNEEGNGGSEGKQKSQGSEDDVLDGNPLIPD